jgi:hypothetical protein
MTTAEAKEQLFQYPAFYIASLTRLWSYEYNNI